MSISAQETKRPPITQHLSKAPTPSSDYNEKAQTLTVKTNLLEDDIKKFKSAKNIITGKKVLQPKLIV